MTLRTVTYDTATHKIVPIEPTEEMNRICLYPTQLKRAIEAAPEYQEPTKDE